MASFRLNIARIKGCPEPRKLNALLEKYGLPEKEEFGVLNHSAADAAAFGTIIRKTQQSVQRIDHKTGELTAAAVERVTVYPFGVKPDAEVLEVYAGSPSAIEQVGAFLSSCLALPVVVEHVPLDLPAALERLAKDTQKFQLRSIRVSEYSHNSYMLGPYAPKFLDTEHGREFLDEYAEAVVAASVRFAGPTGRAGANLTPRACFGYSCNEDDQPHVQAILRKLM